MAFGEKKQQLPVTHVVLQGPIKGLWKSGQDGGIGRHGSTLHTTTSKLQLKYRTFITQNCQKLS